MAHLRRLHRWLLWRQQGRPVDEPVVLQVGHLFVCPHGHGLVTGWDWDVSRMPRAADGFVHIDPDDLADRYSARYPQQRVERLDGCRSCRALPAAAGWESKASRPPRGQLTESVQASFHACAVNLRAALAASPAPTDTPDERPCPSHPDDGPVRWFAITAPPRFEGDTQQAGELPLCARCADEAYPSDQVEVDSPLRREVRPRRGTDPRPAAVGVCTYDAAPHAMFDDCADWRPAAVAAPREDARPVQPFTVGDGWEGSFDAEGALTLSFSSDVGPQGEYVLDQPEVEHLRGFLAAVDPAVERATPDPDTLAALLAEADGEDWDNMPTQSYADHWRKQARALIAAGVTLNETATTPTQEDA